jgi:methionyl aminopeptidase
MEEEPSKIPLKHGDLFGVDVSIRKEGWCGDTQQMWIVGDDTSAKARLLFDVGYQAMCLGISLVRPGAHLQKIAEEVQGYVESFGFSMSLWPVAPAIRSTGCTRMAG